MMGSEKAGKRLMPLLICAAALLATFLVSSCYSPRYLEYACYVLGGALSLMAALWGLKLTLRWLSRQDLFAPWIAFPIAYVLWFIVGSIDILQVPSGISFGAFDPIPGRISVYAGVGLVGYFSGVRLFSTGRGKSAMREEPAFRFAWNSRMFWGAVLALTLIMLATYTYIVAHIGIPVLSSDPAEARLLIDKYHWFGTPFLASAYTVVFFLLGRVWTNSQNHSSRMKMAVTCGVLFISLLLSSLGARTALFIPILVLLVVYHYVHKSIQLRKIALLGLVLFSLLGTYGYFRDQTVGDNQTWLETAGVPRSIQPIVYCYLYVRYTVATFRDVTDVIPSQVPYQRGAITILPFETFLPGHHPMSDWFFKNLLGNDFIGEGQPAGVLGPFYADFGVLGVFAGMFLWGAILSRLYTWMLRKRTLLAALVFAWATQSGILGLFGGLFPYIDTLLLPVCWVFLDFLIRPAIGGFDSSYASQMVSSAGVKHC